MSERCENCGTTVWDIAVHEIDEYPIRGWWEVVSDNGDNRQFLLHTPQRCHELRAGVCRDLPGYWL